MDSKLIRAGMNERAPELAKILSDSDISNIWHSPKTYREHPLAPVFRCLLNVHSDNAVLHNTEMALKQIAMRPELSGWTRSRISQSIQTDDYSSSASALGEIRAAGALLHSGINVEAVPECDKPTCDFKIQFDGLEAYIEVATKQMAGSTVNLLVSSGSDRERSICPGGAPDPKKKGETIGENVGHKFASIKLNAKQVPTNSVALLWVDVQDEDWWPADITHTKPVVSFNGDFFSGGIWHGFYGSPGIPLFERQSPEERIMTDQYTQSYPGLFSQHDRWSAAVLSFRNGTVVFEHPSPAAPMPDSLTKQLLMLPGADYSDWWIKWPSEQTNALPERIEKATKELNSLARVANFSW